MEASSLLFLLKADLENHELGDGCLHCSHTHTQQGSPSGLPATVYTCQKRKKISMNEHRIIPQKIYLGFTDGDTKMKCIEYLLPFWNPIPHGAKNGSG